MSEGGVFARAWDGIAHYRDRRVVATFGLGMSSGFPLSFVIALLGLWLSEYEVSKSDVGLFALITTFYTWKFLWSPAIDRLSLGPITRVLGQRRGWLFFIQALMTVALLMIAQLTPDKDLYLIAIFASAIAFLSASQDIVIDAYRIEIMEGDDQGYSAASYVFGYRTANYAANVGVLAIAEFYGWAMAISFLPLLFLPSIIGVLFIGEPKQEDASHFLEKERAHGTGSVFADKFREAVILPFKEFGQRDNWFLVLLFIFLFKAGDAVAAIMTAPLIVEMGYSKLEIAWANKTVGFITLMAGVGLGAVLYKQIGVFQALLISGLLMMATNLVFAWLAVGEALEWRLAVTIGLENFATGLGTTVIIAYYAGLCNVNFTATQFALLSSLGNQARAILGAPSGYVAEALGWVEFFIYATLIAMPGLILLAILWKLDIRSQKEYKEAGSAPDSIH